MSDLDRQFIQAQEAEREASKVLVIAQNTGLSAQALNALFLTMKGAL